MPLLVNILQLEQQTLSLKGEMAATQMEWDTRDELIRVSQPLRYDVRGQRLENGVLIQGSLRQTLDCQCVRCLKEFSHEIKLEDWTCLLALTGEEKAAIVNDYVDLTPYFREDIFLAFPQRPLCSPNCHVLVSGHQGEKSDGWQSSPDPVVWAALNKLKLK